MKKRGNSPESIASQVINAEDFALQMWCNCLRRDSSAGVSIEDFGKLIMFGQYTETLGVWMADQAAKKYCPAPKVGGRSL